MPNVVDQTMTLLMHPTRSGKTHRMIQMLKCIDGLKFIVVCDGHEMGMHRRCEAQGLEDFQIVPLSEMRQRLGAVDRSKVHIQFDHTALAKVINEARLGSG